MRVVICSRMSRIALRNSYRCGLLFRRRPPQIRLGICIERSILVRVPVSNQRVPFYTKLCRVCTDEYIVTYICADMYHGSVYKKTAQWPRCRRCPNRIRANPSESDLHVVSYTYASNRNVIVKAENTDPNLIYSARKKKGGGRGVSFSNPHAEPQSHFLIRGRFPLSSNETKFSQFQSSPTSNAAMTSQQTRALATR